MATTISHLFPSESGVHHFKIYTRSGTQVGMTGGVSGLYSIAPIALGRARFISEDIPIGVEPDDVAAGEHILEFQDDWSYIAAIVNLIPDVDNPLSGVEVESALAVLDILAEVRRVPRGVSELPRGTYRMTDEQGKVADIDLTPAP